MYRRCCPRPKEKGSIVERSARHGHLCVYMCVSVIACVSACMRARMRALRVCVCVCIACVCVHKCVRVCVQGCLFMFIFPTQLLLPFSFGCTWLAGRAQGDNNSNPEVFQGCMQESSVQKAPLAAVGPGEATVSSALVMFAVVMGGGLGTRTKPLGGLSHPVSKHLTLQPSVAQGLRHGAN